MDSALGGLLPRFANSAKLRLPISRLCHRQAPTANPKSLAHAQLAVGVIRSGAALLDMRAADLHAALFGQREREPASIGQVERFISADVDVGRIHRLAVVERPAQIEAATATLRQFS